MPKTRSASQGLRIPPVLGLLTTLSVVLAIKIPWALNEVSPWFLFKNVAYLEYIEPTSQLLPVPEGAPNTDILFHPAAEAIVYSISLLGGVEPTAVQFLPIGAVLIPLLTFVVVLRWTGTIPASLAATLVGLEAVSPAFYTVFAHAWGYCLFVFSLLLLSIRHHRVLTVLGLVLAFAGISASYYSAQYWMVGLFALIGLAGWLNPQFLGESFGSSIRSLAVLFGVGFLAFNRAFYNNFLPRVRLEQALESIDTFLLRTPVATDGPAGAFTTAPYSGTSIFLLNVSILAILLGIVVLATFYIARRINRGERQLRDLLAIGLLAITIVDIAVYAVYGSIVTRLLLFLVPVVGAIVISRSERGETTLVFVLVLLVVLSVSKGVLLQDSAGQIYAPNTYEDVKPSTGWALRYGMVQPVIFSDFRTLNQITVLSVQEQESVRQVHLSGESYSWLVGEGLSDMPAEETPDFIFLPQLRDEYPLQGLFWQTYEPFSIHLDSINHNAGLGRVYEDGLFRLYSPNDNTARHMDGRT